LLIQAKTTTARCNTFSQVIDRHHGDQKFSGRFRLEFISQWIMLNGLISEYLVVT